MSTTELDMSAGAGAVPAAEQDETALPEQQTAGDAHQQGETEEGADQSRDEGGDKLTPEQRTIKKLESRIARLTAKRGASEREAELRREEAQMLRQQLAEIQRGAQGHEGGDEEVPRRQSHVDIDQLAEQRAKQIIEGKTIRERVSQLLEEGEKLEGFSEAVDELASAVPFKTHDGRPSPFIKAVLDARVPAVVLKYLGENVDEAEDLAELPPVQLGWRLSELTQKLKSAKKQTSAAPTPIRPVGGNHAGSVEPDPDKDPEAWIRARNRAAVRAS